MSKIKDGIFMARFCPLYSSSSGNCTYIGTSQGGILVDIGVSAKKTTEALAEIGVSPEDIKAIYITHEHTDHIRGLKVFAGRHQMDVYASNGTAQAMCDMGIITPKINLHALDMDGQETAGMFVKPFRTSHDSAESVGYIINTPDNKKISIATDLGIVTQSIGNAISGSDLVLLESNHDIDMLKRGPYPYYLKQRILSDKGHLSNETCADVASKLLKRGTVRFVLGHLSAHNNFPPLAFETTNSAFKLQGAKENSDYLLSVAKADGGNKLITF